MVGKIPKKNPRDGVDKYGRTELHYASDLTEIERLVSSGLDINLPDDNGWVPMHFYAQDSNSKAIRLSLKLGANPNLQDTYGNSPLWTATMNARGYFDCVIALLKAGAISDKKNSHGRSPLGMANTLKHGLDEVFAKYGSNT